jgi:hypothetical protein
MNVRLQLFTLLILVLSVPPAFCQQPSPPVNIAPNAPRDKPVETTADQVHKFEEAIKPYIEMAKKSYPEAKARFQAGLPAKHSFFITTRLHDSSGNFEQVFIAVQEIKDGKVSGLIWSDINVVKGYKPKDSYTFPESELIDWTISKPDGTEEGNFVGKFLDSYRPDSVVKDLVWRKTPATPELMAPRLKEAADKYQANAPIPRIVMFDIGYPKDIEEYEALDAHAVLLLTVLTQSQNEIPLKRVYVQVDGRELELVAVKQILSSQNSDDVITRTFGRFRMDALYLLPMQLRIADSDLLVDFAQNRTAMKVATFGTPLPDELQTLPSRLPKGTLVEKALESFVKREYPSFF